jgi:hypothetical protein
MHRSLQIDIFLFTVLALFIVSLVGNYSSRFTDPLLHDLTIAVIMVVFLIVWKTAYDNVY